MLVFRVGIAPVLEGIYDSNSEKWNSMVSKDKIDIIRTGPFDFTLILYAIELMFSNNYLEDFTQQNLDQSYSLEEWYDALWIPLSGMV